MTLAVSHWITRPSAVSLIMRNVSIHVHHKQVIIKRIIVIIVFIDPVDSSDPRLTLTIAPLWIIRESLKGRSAFTQRVRVRGNRMVQVHSRVFPYRSYITASFPEEAIWREGEWAWIITSVPTMIGKTTWENEIDNCNAFALLIRDIKDLIRFFTPELFWPNKILYTCVEFFLTNYYEVYTNGESYEMREIVRAHLRERQRRVVSSVTPVWNVDFPRCNFLHWPFINGRPLYISSFVSSTDERGSVCHGASVLLNDR